MTDRFQSNYRREDGRLCTPVDFAAAEALEHIAKRLDDLVELLTPPPPEFREIPRGEDDRVAPPVGYCGTCQAPAMPERGPGSPAVIRHAAGCPEYRT